MARYKPYDVDHDKFIPVSFRDQLHARQASDTVWKVVFLQAR